MVGSLKAGEPLALCGAARQDSTAREAALTVGTLAKSRFKQDETQTTSSASIAGRRRDSPQTAAPPLQLSVQGVKSEPELRRPIIGREVLERAGHAARLLVGVA